MTTSGFRHRGLVAGLIATLLVVALVFVASLPTGADSPEGTVPRDARVAASATVDDVEVLLVSTGGRLSVHVAYEGPKGWLAAELSPAPAHTWAAWAGSAGDGPVPPLAVVYGRSPADRVVVRWVDGEEGAADVASDGLYLAVRPQRVEAAGVAFFDDAGALVAEAEL